MSIAQYIKEIGRGGSGARALSSSQAYDLMSQVLDGAVTDLEIGAFTLAMRMKGETLEELTGFSEAVHERCMSLRSNRPVVLLPSYNGARRLPNLTPLLAMRLAQEGVHVLVHGPGHDPSRVTTADVFNGLGLPMARSAHEVERAWGRHEPAFMRTDVLCPPLARLLDVRWVVGVRNSGHTVAKMLNPVHGARALRVVNHTHPEFGELMAAFARSADADMLLLRGTEGEPVADPRRQPRLDVVLQGQPRAELSVPAHEGVLTELPVLPRSHDAATTALYIQSAISGEKPIPAPLEQQVQAVTRALEAMATPDSVGMTA
ncbi:MAG TPA: DNA-binding protein YbiB [Burkholderiaceae bacterium]|nr:DNA-binding protein YbiB [Burkholderiaceae bacterium]